LDLDSRGSGSFFGSHTPCGKELKKHIIRTAKEQVFLTVHQFFALDSQSMGIIQDTLKNNLPHLMEIMPGVIPKAIKRFAGGRVRFVTNSPYVVLKAEIRPRKMPHFAPS